MKKNKKKIILIHLLTILVVAVYVMLIRYTSLSCPIKMIFHIPCPFCGMTRAFIAATGGNFSLAFKYNPLFILALPLMFFALHRHLKPISRLSDKAYNIVVISGAVLFFGVYIIRVFILKINI